MPFIEKEKLDSLFQWLLISEEREMREERRREERREEKRRERRGEGRRGGGLNIEKEKGGKETYFWFGLKNTKKKKKTIF